MVATVEERDLDVHHRITRQSAVFRRFPNTLLYRWNVFAGNRPTFNGIDKLESTPWCLGLKLDPDIAILSPTACLADESSLLLDGLSDRLFIRYLGFPTFAPTLNSRSNRSTIISKWSSPIPDIIVWPVSSSVRTLNDGSSVASF